MEILTGYWFLWLIFALLVYLAYVILRPTPVSEGYETPWISSRAGDYSFVVADSQSIAAKPNFQNEDVPAMWRMRMERYAAKMRSHQVEAVIFVNGTYAGFDPMDLIQICKIIWPNMPSRIENRFRKLSLAGLNRLVKDCGNFQDDYVRMFSQLTGGLPAENFKWSSANHHAARLQGAIDLIKCLDDKIRKRTISSDGRVLLIGHSHAGQVFSIVTQLLDSHKRESLISVAAEVFLARSELESMLSTINNLKLDFVTLGMPPRYLWNLNSRMQLINIINHRGQTHKAGSIRGLLHTVDGDYVQQAGIRGTDSAVAVPKLRMANQRLNDILDGGPDIKRWLSDMRLKNRIPKFGYTYLVDYGDRSEGMPNLFRTIFGHGVYTEGRFLEFNTRIITDHFYR